GFPGRRTRRGRTDAPPLTSRRRGFEVPPARRGALARFHSRQRRKMHAHPPLRRAWSLVSIVVLTAALAPGHSGAADAPARQPLRPPAVPLVTHDPYFSNWSANDRL